MNASLVVLFEPVDGHTTVPASILAGRVDQAGNLSTYAIPPGRYLVRLIVRPIAAHALEGWALESAALEGRDVSVVPLDLRGDVSGLILTMTDRQSELAGVVRDGQGRPDGEATVFVFPATRALWLDTGPAPRQYRAVRASEGGAYAVRGLPAGDYLVAAVDDEGIDEWSEPTFLEQVSRRASSARVVSGGQTTLDLVASVR